MQYETTSNSGYLIDELHMLSARRMLRNAVYVYSEEYWWEKNMNGLSPAGPGGIASVGKLLDAGVLPSDIAWIDS